MYKGIGSYKRKIRRQVSLWRSQDKRHKTPVVSTQIRFAKQDQYSETRKEGIMENACRVAAYLLLVFLLGNVESLS